MTIPDTKPLSHPVQLLVNALATAKSGRDSNKAAAEQNERCVAGYRKYEATNEARVVELTKALKKLGHKV